MVAICMDYLQPPAAAACPCACMFCAAAATDAQQNLQSVLETYALPRTALVTPFAPVCLMPLHLHSSLQSQVLMLCIPHAAGQTSSGAAVPPGGACSARSRAAARVLPAPACAGCGHQPAARGGPGGHTASHVCAAQRAPAQQQVSCSCAWAEAVRLVLSNRLNQCALSCGTTPDQGPCACRGTAEPVLLVCRSSSCCLVVSEMPYCSHSTSGQQALSCQ